MGKHRTGCGYSPRMSFGLGRGKPLDVAPGTIGVQTEELGPLPDDLLERPESAWVDLRALFREPDRPVEIEIGPGKGAFLLEQAAASPETNYLAIEWAGEFYAYTADRVRRRGLGNVRVLHADARDFLRWRTPSRSVRCIHLYFSDPWPKAKHHKNRVVSDPMLAQAWRTLTPGGELRIVTDHDGYWQWIDRHAARWTTPQGWNALAVHLRPLGSSHRSDPDPGDPHHAAPFLRRAFTPPEWARPGELVGTNFERKFRTEGRDFHGCVLVRAPDQASTGAR